jgi:hypothetical protein
MRLALMRWWLRCRGEQLDLYLRFGHVLRQSLAGFDWRMVLLRR